MHQSSIDLQGKLQQFTNECKILEDMVGEDKTALLTGDVTAEHAKTDYNDSMVCQLPLAVHAACILQLFLIKTRGAAAVSAVTHQICLMSTPNACCLDKPLPMSDTASKPSAQQQAQHHMDMLILDDNCVFIVSTTLFLLYAQLQAHQSPDGVVCAKCVRSIKLVHTCMPLHGWDCQLVSIVWQRQSVCHSKPCPQQEQPGKAKTTQLNCDKSHITDGM